MPVFRCWLYMNQGKQGWKESFYLTGVTHVEALGQLGLLALARAQLLGDQVELVRLLVTNEPPDRSYLAAAGPPSPGNGPATSPHTALLLRLEVGPAGLYHRNVYLRGLPKTWFAGKSLQTLQLTSQGSKAVKAFIDALVSLGFSIRSNNKTAPCYPIVDVQPQVPPGFILERSPWVLLQTSVNTLLQEFDADGNSAYVTVAGIKWRPEPEPGRKVNGVWPILAIGFQQVILSASAPAEGIYLGGGFVQGRGVVYSPITGGMPLRMVQKDTGRALPFEAGQHQVPPPPIRIGEASAEERFVPHPFHVFPGPVHISPEGQINNALDMAAFVFSGYPSDVLSIAVAPDLNHVGVYVIAIPGTNADSNANVWAAIKSAFKYNTEFTNDVRRAITAGIPHGSEIILAGHSQGAMVAQNLVKELWDNGYVVRDVVCYGAPVSTELDEDTHYVFFVASFDPIPLLVSPTGVGVNPATGEPTPQAEKTLFEGIGDIFDLSLPRHNCYSRAPVLTGYDAVGVVIQQPKKPFIIQLGPITRYGIAPPKF